MRDDLITISGEAFPLLKALVGFRDDIEGQINRFPFETNVFLMMRFRRSNKKLSDFIIKTLKEGGFNGVRADHPEWNITKNVYNPIACIFCCKYGIALFDAPEPDQAYNPNVIYELGMMHLLRRECLILKDDSVPSVPFDLIKDLYSPYKGQLAVQANVRRWLQQIAPHSVESALPAQTRKTQLELAAVGATKDAKNAVVATPEEISSSGLTWRISSRSQKNWNVSWSIKLTNNSNSPASIAAQILFVDENGFALEDHIGHAPKILPGRTITLEANVLTSPDLARRIRHAFATVSRVGK